VPDQTSAKAGFLASVRDLNGPSGITGAATAIERSFLTLPRFTSLQPTMMRPFRETDLLAQLDEFISTGLAQRWRDELCSEVSFAEPLLVHDDGASGANWVCGYRPRSSSTRRQVSVKSHWPLSTHSKSTLSAKRWIVVGRERLGWITQFWPSKDRSDFESADHCQTHMGYY